MTDDLSTRLLAKIEEQEREINAWEHYQVEDSIYHCCAALRTEESAGDLPFGECDCGLGARRAEALRFCQAHREIVAEYTGALFTQSCHPEYEDNNGFVTGLSRVITHLAHGYE